MRSDGQASWHRVRLPDTWHARGRPTKGEATYRLHFDLAQAPEVALAAVFSRLSTENRVLLNGRLLSGDTSAALAVDRGQPAPALIELPPTLLQPGPNELTLELRYRIRAGLSAPEIGPAPLMRTRFEQLLLWQETLPQALNLAAVGIAGLMLLIWWRRRSEAAVGSFGALSMVGALRNYAYLLHGKMLPAWLNDGLFYLAQVGTVVLFGLFAQNFANRHSRRYTRLLLGLGLTLALLAIAALIADRTQLLRRVSYPLLLGATVPALWLMFERARQAGSRSIVGVLLGMLAVVGAGAHDYAFHTGLLGVTQVFWLPYAMPVALAAFSWLLMARMVGSMAEVEALNAGARVARRGDARASSNSRTPRRHAFSLRPATTCASRPRRSAC